MAQNQKNRPIWSHCSFLAQYKLYNKNVDGFSIWYLAPDLFITSFLLLKRWTKNTHDNTLQYPVSWFEVSYIPIQSNLGIAVKSSQFKEGVIGMNILNLSVTYLTTSVTRWPDCFVKIWPFTTITICPKENKMFQRGFTTLPNTK